MAKMELIIQSNVMQSFKKEKIRNFEIALQMKIENLRRGDCNLNKTLIAVMEYESHAISCGFGCQMHYISAAFLCSIEKDRLFLVKNYEKSKYNKYFAFFDEKCINTNYSTNYVGMLFTFYALYI